MTTDGLLTRQDILAGLMAKRARTLLFLVESRTAHLMTRSRHAVERFATEETAQDRDLAFLEAFSLGQRPPQRPTIQDLERHAPQWASLIPESPRLRAALAHSLGRTYAFTSEFIPNIRAVLGLDETEVPEAYQRLYGQLLSEIYASQVKLTDRLRWGKAALTSRLESLPPFWTAFALTLTETVGAGILALPIATAGVGPLAGVAFLVVFGLVNVLTIACMAEAISRSGTIRYGNAFIGRVVRDYLGNVGSLILSLGTFAICFLVLWAYYMGFSATMEDATTIPAEIWVAVLFLVGLYYVRRESLSATVASALLVGLTNIGLILMLSLLALTHVRPENLAFVNVPFVGGRPFDASILGLIFGVISLAYFGHLSVSNCARAVIRQDPSGRSLIWGCMAAQITTIFIYSIWVIAVNGAIDPQALSNEPGTALIPLSREIGAAITVLGSVFVILGMGMASIHFSLGLYNLTREWLPKHSQPIITLPRRRGRVLLRARRQRPGDRHIAITYLGLQDNQPLLRLDVQKDGHTHRTDVVIGDRWTSDQHPVLGQGDDHLALEVVQAGGNSLCLRLETTLRVAYEGEWDTVGLSMADVPVLDDVQRTLITWLMRRQTARVSDVAAYLELEETEAEALMTLLVNEGLIVETERDGERHYRVLLSSRGRRTVPQQVWQKLGLPGQPVSREESPGAPARALAALRRVLNRAWAPRARSILSLVPIALVFVLTEWFLFTGAGSFSELLGFIGVIVISLLSGIFPVLLLASSRRKGEFLPGVVYRFLGHPVLLGGIYALSLSSLFLHGLVIWQDPWQRLGALLVGVAMIGVTIFMQHQGAFNSRLVVALREDHRAGEGSGFAIMAAGQPATATVCLETAAGEREVQAPAGQVADLAALRRAVFRLPAGLAQELKVWVHQVTATGDSQSVSGHLDVHAGKETAHFDLNLMDEAIILPLDDAAYQVDVDLEQVEGRE